MPEHHKTVVVRIKEILPHPNADKLEIYPIDGTSYRYVGTKNQFKIGDLAYYVTPDSVVPERPEYAFLWEGQTSPIPTKRRRIKAKKLRKEWSEGLLMPLEIQPDGDAVIFSPNDSSMKQLWIREGDDLAGILGITHYEPPEEPELDGTNERAPGSRQNKIFPRSLKGWSYFLLRVCSFGLLDINGRTGGGNEKSPDNYRPIYDVEALKNFPNAFKPGEEVIVTEKIHGSNARFTFVPGTFGGKMYAGSRKLWKKPGKNVWREALKQNPWIEWWCKENPDYTLYGEVVPTQEMKYGCQGNEVKFFIFDIRTPQGEWDNLYAPQCQEIIDNRVPLLYRGPYDKDKILSLVDGKSTVKGADNIREGVVIRPVVERDSGVRGLGRLQLKVISNAYLEKA